MRYRRPATRDRELAEVSHRGSVDRGLGLAAAENCEFPAPLAVTRFADSGKFDRIRSQYARSSGLQHQITMGNSTWERGLSRRVASNARYVRLGE